MNGKDYIIYREGRFWKLRYGERFLYILSRGDLEEARGKARWLLRNECDEFVVRRRGKEKTISVIKGEDGK